MITKYIKQQLLSPQIMTCHPPALHPSSKCTHLAVFGFRTTLEILSNIASRLLPRYVYANMSLSEEPYGKRWCKYLSLFRRNKETKVNAFDHSDISE